MRTRTKSIGLLRAFIEQRMETEERKEQEFFTLSERFRRATDPADVERLGEELGRMVFVTAPLQSRLSRPTSEPRV